MRCKAIIIEDDVCWYTSLRIILEKLDIELLGTATNVSEAIDLLNVKTPDLILADVKLNNEIVFDIFKSNKTLLSIPTIFITQSEEEVHYEASKEVISSLFITKPVHELSLKSAIGNLCKQHHQINSSQPTGKIIVRGNFNEKIEIPFDKISYIKQIKHYCTIHTVNQQFVQKKSLTNLIKLLDERFLQIHRSYCINTDFIDNYGLGLKTLKINSLLLPVGMTYTDTIKQYISKKSGLKL